MTLSRFSLAFICLLSSAALAAPASLSDATQMFRQGRHTTALEKVNAYLAGSPKDAQGRFLKGLILTELNRYPEAIKVFNDLADDYPELPEPYNNLAVLYAAQGQYEQAKNSLEMAIRTHPSYATAHENLGDIYAKMASLSYDKALQLDKSNVSAQTKLSLIKDLFSPTPVTPPAVPPPAAQETRPEADVKPAVPVAAASSNPSPAAPTQSPTHGVDSSLAQPPQDSKLAARPADSAKPAPAAEDAQAAVDKAKVETVIEDWRAAWSRKDVEGYLGYYAPDFDLPSNMTRSAWEQQRRTRITAPAFIKVELDKIQVVLEGGKATASFRQRYESDRFKSSGLKTLTLEQRDGAWKIVREQ